MDSIQGAIAAEARKAGVAREDTLLFLMPPFFIAMRLPATDHQKEQNWK